MSDSTMFKAFFVFMALGAASLITMIGCALFDQFLFAKISFLAVLVFAAIGGLIAFGGAMGFYNDD